MAVAFCRSSWPARLASLGDPPSPATPLPAPGRGQAAPPWVPRPPFSAARRCAVPPARRAGSWGVRGGHRPAGRRQQRPTCGAAWRRRLGQSAADGGARPPGPLARQRGGSMVGARGVVHSFHSFIRKLLGSPFRVPHGDVALRGRQREGDGEHTCPRTVRSAPEVRIWARGGVTGTAWAEGGVLLEEGVPPVPSPGGGGAGLPRATPAMWGSSVGEPARLAQNPLQGGPCWGVGAC